MVVRPAPSRTDGPVGYMCGDAYVLLGRLAYNQTLHIVYTCAYAIRIVYIRNTSANAKN